MNVFCNLLCILIALSFAACSKNSNAQSNSQAGVASQTLTSLQGKWIESNCQTFGSGGSQTSGQLLLTITESQWTYSYRSFKTPNCAGSISSSIDSQFTYSVPGATTTDPNLLYVDLKMGQISATMLDQDTANAVNAISYCGYSDWVVGVPKDLDGNTCIKGWSTGTMQYTIAKSDSLHLQVGQTDSTHSGSSPNQRTQALSSDVFNRQ